MDRTNTVDRLVSTGTMHRKNKGNSRPCGTRRNFKVYLQDHESINHCKNTRLFLQRLSIKEVRPSFVRLDSCSHAEGGLFSAVDAKKCL